MTGFAGTSYEPTWTTEQAAEFLGIARKTLYNRVSLGTAPAPRKMGRLNGFIPSELAAYREEILGLESKKPAVAPAGQNINN